MNVSALLSFPGSLLWLYAITGIAAIVGGLLWYRRAASKRPLKRAALELLSGQAWRWWVPQEALADFSWSLSRFGSLCCIGFGLGSLLLTVVEAGLLMSPVWSQICSFSIGNLSVSAWVLATILGGGGGGLYAFRRLRGEASAWRPAGPRRILRDYRSPLFFVFLAAEFVLVCVLVFTFHPSRMPINDCLLDSQIFSSGLWQWWIAVPLMVFTGVTLLTHELMLSGVASARSPLVPTALSDVAGLDDMFRDRIIRALQYLELLQMSLLYMPFSSLISLPEPYSDIVVFIPILGIGILLLFFVLSLASSGGLGGRLIGWFWQRRRAA